MEDLLAQRGITVSYEAIRLWCIKMVENFSNDFVVGNKSDHTQGPTALTFQRVNLIDPFDEPRPTFSESGALFWRELGFGLGF